MKVILTQDVEKLGDSHEVVDVREGYARNFLVPRGLALVATKSALANIENMRRLEVRRQSRLRGEAEAIATKLEEQLIVIEANAGEGGRLFGSVGTADIAKQIEEALDVAVDRRQIQLNDPIRSVGEYLIPIKLHKEVQAQLKVQVSSNA